ncbi:hypothetical protein [Methylocella sp.]|uniref:hypothetical protein n=1 Tax=Methylocella sp. TaxID=1978226 RepID=UPI003783A797
MTVDRMLVLAGVAAALGSVAFAGAMLSRDNSRPMFGGVEHLMIFAQPIGGSKLQREPVASGAAVDFNATGSIGASGGRNADPGPGGKTVVKNYVLRVAPQGALVVEGPKGRVEAKPGAVVPDLGSVLSVQNRNGRWRVVTERGAVLEAE